MPKSELIFESSPLLIALCLIIGAVYAYLLYRKSGPWPITVNRLLAVLRFATVSIISFLILGPLIKQFRNTVEDPAYVILFDNTLSVSEVMDSSSVNSVQTELDGLSKALASSGKSMSTKSFDPGAEPMDILDIQADHKSSDISKLLNSIQDERAGTNLAGVVLVSDGIFNRGLSPLYSNYSFPIYTVGIGDTIPKADINLQNVYHNKIAYQGNQFPIIAEIFNNGFDNINTQVTITHNGEILEEKTLEIRNSEPLVQMDFLINAEEKGPQHYIIDLKAVEGEFTLSNNRKHIYVDVIDGKEKILIVANSPHPDIKAIRTVLEQNENYEFNLYIPGLVSSKPELLNEKYDLVIFHQWPGSGRSVDLSQLIDQNSSFLYILGNKTNLDAFNQMNQVVQVQARLQQKDAVTPVYNPNFSKFSFNPELLPVIRSFPPVNVPFGTYNLMAGADVILYQQFGSVETGKPLLAVTELDDRKYGVILGDNFWKWKLQEFALSGEHTAFNQLFSKLIQYLSSKEDKRKFKVYTVNKEFTDNEPVIFDTEIYNDIYEKVYNQKVDLSITSEDGEVKNYSYVNSEANSRFRVSDLEQGTYQFEASTQIDDTRETVRGNFIVSALQIESLNLTADHNLLRQLSERTGGEFYASDQMAQLQSDLLERETPGVIHSTQTFLPLLNLPWILFLMIILFSAEWFIRKYQGSY